MSNNQKATLAQYVTEEGREHFFTLLDEVLKNNKLFSMIPKTSVSPYYIGSANAFFVFRMIYVKYREETNKDWTIKNTDNSASKLLQLVSSNYGMNELVKDLENAVDILRSFLYENFNCRGVTVNIEGILRLKYYNKLKDKLNNEYGIKSYLNDSGLILSGGKIKIRHVYGFTTIKTEKENDSTLINIPLSTLLYIDIDEALEQLFKNHNLVGELNNIMLQDMFAEETYNVRSILDRKLNAVYFSSKFNFDNIVDDAFSFSEEIKKANPNADIEEILHLYSLEDIHTKNLESALIYNDEENMTHAIKTLHGLYYFKADKRTLSFIDLDTYYSNNYFSL